MKILRIITALAVLLLALNCARRAKEETVSDQSAAPVATAAYSDRGASPVANPGPDPAGQMIIRNGDLTITVENAEKSLTAVRSIAKRHEGFVADSRVWRVESQHRANVVIRVPAAKLDALIAELKQVAIRIENESLSGQDVTAEYVDLGSRLRNLEAAEVELRELLRTVRLQAKKAIDILEVYRELTNIRGEIEQVKGRMKYLAEHAAMATLRVELVPEVAGTPVGKSAWSPIKTMKEAGRALVVSAQHVANTAIWLLVYIVPILAILALPLVILIKAIRSRRAVEAA